MCFLGFGFLVLLLGATVGADCVESCWTNRNGEDHCMVTTQCSAPSDSRGDRDFDRPTTKDQQWDPDNYRNDDLVHRGENLTNPQRSKPTPTGAM